MPLPESEPARWRPIGEPGKSLTSPLLAEAAGLEVEPHLEVLLDGEAVEHVVPLGHVADASLDGSSWAGRFVTGSPRSATVPSRTGTNPKSALMSVDRLRADDADDPPGGSTSHLRRMSTPGR